MHYVGVEPPASPFRALAQIRYRAQPADVTVTPMPGGKAHVQFDVSQRDITPGQFLVLYDSDILLGGGSICMRREDVL